MVSDVLDGTYEKVNDSNQHVVVKQEESPGGNNELQHMISEIHLAQPPVPVAIKTASPPPKVPSHFSLKKKPDRSSKASALGHG